jgi:hypothetical protein
VIACDADAEFPSEWGGREKGIVSQECDGSMDSVTRLRCKFDPPRIELVQAKKFLIFR